MKKSKLFFLAALIGAISTAVVTLYLLRDYLKDTPLSRLFVPEEEYDFTEEYEILDEDDTEEESFKIVEEAPVKEKAVKVRRGYIPLKFHEAN